MTIKRPGTITARGVTVQDYSNAISHTVDGTSVQFRSTDMSLDQRDSVSVQAVVYFPPGTDVEAGDIVVFDGVEYRIDGAPLPVTSPTGRISHIKASIVDWEG